MRMAVRMAAMVMVAAGGAAFGQGAGAASGPAAEGAAGGAKWAGVVKGLSSADFKEREAAGKVLEGATWRDLEELRALAKGATDSEVKARVEQRVEALEEVLALDPPPISVKLEGAGVAGVAAALSGETGARWQTSAGGVSKDTFTLEMKDKPLWEVYLALNQQHPLAILPRAEDIQLMSGQRGVVMGDVEKGFLFYPQTLARQVDFQGREPRPMVTFSFGMLGDPRLKLAKCGMPRVTRVEDETGSVLYRGGEGGEDAWMGYRRLVEMSTGVGFAAPETMGKKLTVHGEVTVALALAETTVEVADMEKQGTAPIEVGPVSYSFRKFVLTGDRLELAVSQERSGGQRNMPAVELGTPVTMRLVDGSGKEVVHQMMNAGMSMTRSGVKGPVKGEFTVATRVKSVEVPFVFKDLAAP
jgi:hypothetical protein